MVIQPNEKLINECLNLFSGKMNFFFISFLFFPQEVKNFLDICIGGKLSCVPFNIFKRKPIV